MITWNKTLVRKHCQIHFILFVCSLALTHKWCHAVVPTAHYSEKQNSLKMSKKQKHMANYYADVLLDLPGITHTPHA